MRRLDKSILCAALTLSSCGYHISGKGEQVPKTVQTIAVPAFTNLTIRYRLTDRLPEAISRELIARTHYLVVPNAETADAVLRGAVVNYVAYPVIFDQRTGHATAIQCNVTLQVSLVERATGKVIYTRPSFEMKQQYEISVDAKQYFQESTVALDRVSRDIARTLVSGILENF